MRTILNVRTLCNQLHLKSGDYRFEYVDADNNAVVFLYSGPEGCDDLICYYNRDCQEWDCYFKGKKVGTVGQTDELKSGRIIR
jgi:hypothetical protein